MSSDYRKNCFIQNCKGEAMVVCCCSELFICEDHFDDHHRNCDSKLYSVSKYFEAMERNKATRLDSKEKIDKVMIDIINRAEALVSIIHSESLKMLATLNNAFKSTLPKPEIIEFDIDLEFFKLFEKLGNSEQALLNNEDLALFKTNLLKEKNEVLTLKKNLDERESALVKRRTQLYNFELQVAAKQRDLDNILEDLFTISNLEMKKRILFLTGFIDWRVRDAVELRKTNDKRFLFDCKIY